MEQGAGRGPEEFREAARQAREQLLGQLGAESERLDRELAELAERMLDGALRIAGQRVDDELERLHGASAALGEELRSELRDEIARRLKKARRRLSKSIEERLAEEVELLSRDSRRSAAQLADQLAERVDAQGFRLRGEIRRAVVEQVAEAARDLDRRREDLGGAGADIRAAAKFAEQRVAQAVRIAEMTIATKVQSATAAAICDLTATATDLSRRIERQAFAADAADRLGEVLSQLRAAEGRLRDSDERTRRALRHLRAVPDQG